MVFDYGSLPRDFKRRYLPKGLRFEWAELAAIFDELSSRKIGASEELRKWMLDESELAAYIHEQRAVRYINSTRQTDNPVFTKAYESYLTELEPKIKLAGFELLKKYASSEHRGGLPKPDYSLEDKRRRNAVSIFRPENVELEKQDSTLGQKYLRTIGAMTVQFRGQERTLQQMSKFYEETDRAVREEAWRLADQRALKDSPALDRLYDEMVALRDREARNAGFDDYMQYAFAKKDRFDYTAADCVRFHEAVEKYMVPLSRELDKERKAKMGLDELRPWDLKVDPDGRPPLSPFEDAAGLLRGAAQVIRKVDQQLSGFFARMVELQLLDLESRKGKAPGGYQEDLSEVRLPFIFMNAAKRDGDVRTLLHESGHSFHTFLMREQGLPFFNANASLPFEFAEVASTSMELMSGEHYEGAFYSSEGARRSNMEEAMGNVKLFTWVATIDAFQHWVYTNPQHTKEERAEAWVRTFNRFSGLESYDGLEPSRAYRWHRQLHLFEVPFYYIEYGIALTGALGIWSRYRSDRREAVTAYKRALSLGASRPLPELFKAAGLEWGFGESALKKHAALLRSAIREFGE